MSVAIITGASSGIGSEFARQLSRRPDVTEFWFIARRAARMEALAAELGVSARIISADLSTSEGIESVRSALAEARPEVGYLINAAGFGTFGTYSELDDGEAERMIDLNVKALVLITNAVIPYMKRGGRIIELGSGSCFTPLPAFNVYAASKSFVLHYTKALNYELRERGLRACCFCPGWVGTDFIDKALSNSSATHPRREAMKPLLNVERAVRGCIRAVDRGRRMYVTNAYTKLQHLLFKLLPDRLLTRAWLGMLEAPNEEQGEEPRGE